MDEGLVASFIAAAEEILQEIGLEVSRVSTAAVSAPGDDARPAYVATVGIVGNARGSLLLRLDRSSAANIVAAMYRSMGLENRQPRDISEGAIAEIANLICGRAVTLLSRRSVECDITPPAVISGTELTTSVLGSEDLEYRRLDGPFGSLVMILGWSD
jgi:CheY-specific phosphatase CheX